MDKCSILMKRERRVNSHFLSLTGFPTFLIEFLEKHLQTKDSVVVFVLFCFPGHQYASKLWGFKIVFTEMLNIKMTKPKAFKKKFFM